MESYSVIYVNYKNNFFLNKEHRLTEVCQVQFTSNLVALCDHIALGEHVKNALDERLSKQEFADNQLATLLLVVLEQNLADEITMRKEKQEKPVWDGVTHIFFFKFCVCALFGKFVFFFRKKEYFQNILAT
jgi:hypothetical protein